MVRGGLHFHERVLAALSSHFAAGGSMLCQTDMYARKLVFWRHGALE